MRVRDWVRKGRIGRIEWVVSVRDNDVLVNFNVKRRTGREMTRTSDDEEGRIPSNRLVSAVEETTVLALCYIAMERYSMKFWTYRGNTS